MDKYAVIGNPIEHSLSPEIHTAFAKQTQQALSYEKIEAPLNLFEKTVETFLKQGGLGCNVTIPFKQIAYDLVDTLDISAKSCGAVNTIAVKNKQLIGYNTDGAGLLLDLTKNLNIVLSTKRILLIGAGGAAKGVLPNLLQEQPKALVLVNRTISKAEAIISECQHSHVSACGFEDLIDQHFDLVINATSSSLDEIDLPLPSTIFSEEALSYDMLYSQRETRFLQWSRRMGAKKLADGFGMLVEQAALAFNIWRGVRPDTKVVIMARRSAA